MSPPPDLSEASDQDVVTLALQRRTGAYAELVRRYGQRVYLLIYSVVGSEERAIDLTQDTFFKVAMFLQNYRPDKSLAAWILTIAHHTAVDYVRRRPVDSTTGPLSVPLSVIDASGKWATDPFAEPTPDPGTPELRATLEHALQQLSPAQRRCVELHVLEQRTYEDVATTLRLPVGTVKSHVNRAHKKLRTLLGHLMDAADPDHARPPD